MTDWNAKRTVDSTSWNADLYVEAPERRRNIFLNAATAGYSPAVGDILCEKSDDTYKHQKYSVADKANLDLIGIVDEVTEDNTGTPVVQLSVCEHGHVHYTALGYTSTISAAEKLILLAGLRAINIDVAL